VVSHQKAELQWTSYFFFFFLAVKRYWRHRGMFSSGLKVLTISPLLSLQRDFGSHPAAVSMLRFTRPKFTGGLDISEHLPSCNQSHYTDDHMRTFMKNLFLLPEPMVTSMREGAPNVGQVLCVSICGPSLS
jgi:hypothetical protein